MVTERHRQHALETLPHGASSRATLQYDNPHSWGPETGKMGLPTQKRVSPHHPPISLEHCSVPTLSDPHVVVVRGEDLS